MHLMPGSASANFDVTGATSEAQAHHDRALRRFQSWRTGALHAAEQAIEVAPGFVMAHVLRAYILICGRESRNLPKARAALAAVGRGAMTPRERAHVDIVDAFSQLHIDRGQALLDGWIAAHPTDILALQVAHAFDYLLGETFRLRDRIERVLPDWTESMPGYSALLSMHAFGLAENLEHSRAAERCLRVLELDPGCPRAHHAMAHVYERAGLHDAGNLWLDAHREQWSEGTPVSTHLWWHRALHAHSTADIPQVLAIYDAHIAPAAPDGGSIADLIDAASLLWRLWLDGADPGLRAATLAAHWTRHVEDGFCSFNDIHAAMAFAMAGRWDALAALAVTQRRRVFDADAYATTTREVGLPASLGIAACAQGDFERAVQWLGALPAHAYLIGGSTAQRSVLALTLRTARARLSARTLRATPREGLAAATR